MIKRCLFLLPAILLAGCAQKMEVQNTLTPAGKMEAQKTTTEALQTARSASALTAFELQGLMGVKSPKKAFSANVIWAQSGAHTYHIRLSGPIGGGTVLVDRTGGMVTYQDGQKRASSSSASSLFKQETGVALPVDDLYYWVRGLPAPGHAGTQYGPQHELVSLQQAGYNIQYSDYHNVNGYMLPGRVSLEGHGLHIKLIVKHWNV